MSITGFFKITRPANAVVSGVTAIIAFLVATGTVIPQAVLLLVIVALITAAGNVINDYFDADIDLINRPERPIPSGTVALRAARSFAVTLFLAGILIALFTPVLCLSIAVINSLILVLYAAKLKSMPVVGNAAVAYLAASIFLFGGAFAGWDGLVRMIPLAAITFLATMVREILKDAEDVEGDAAGGADTLPIRIGIRMTTRIALGFALAAAAASIVPYFWWEYGTLPASSLLTLSSSSEQSGRCPAKHLPVSGQPDQPYSSRQVCLPLLWYLYSRHFSCKSVQ